MNRYAKRECTKENTKFKRRIRKDRNKVIVACSFPEDRHCSTGLSGCATEVNYVPSMRKALSVLGTIGQLPTSNHCGNYIGACAEPHAANKVLLDRRSRRGPIDDLIFSKAYRIRTKSKVLRDGSKTSRRNVKRVPYCDNCTTVFKSLKK